MARKTIRITLTSNEDPQEELFRLIQAHNISCLPGVIDLDRADIEVSLDQLSQEGLVPIMQGAWHGVQWNWNANSCHLNCGAARLELRVNRPPGV